MGKKCCNFDIFENELGGITIYDAWLDGGVSFDECMAEKICKYIIEVAKEIRERQ